MSGNLFAVTSHVPDDRPRHHAAGDSNSDIPTGARSSDAPTREAQRPGRLSRSRDVRLALRRGRRHAGRLLAAHVLDTDRREGSRLAVIASRRVGNAVERNRAKRLLREAGWRIDWTEGTDAVLVARPGIVGVGARAVHDELEALLVRSAR